MAEVAADRELGGGAEQVTSSTASRGASVATTAVDGGSPAMRASFLGVAARTSAAELERRLLTLPSSTRRNSGRGGNPVHVVAAMPPSSRLVPARVGTAARSLRHSRLCQGPSSLEDTVPHLPSSTAAGVTWRAETTHAT